MSPDAKEHIRDNMQKQACLGYKIVETSGEWGDGRRDKLGPLADILLCVSQQGCSSGGVYAP